jgi:hypothetical protein
MSTSGEFFAASLIGGVRRPDVHISGVPMLMLPTQSQHAG